jgi:oligopeptide transport system permease protein
MSETTAAQSTPTDEPESPEGGNASGANRSLWGDAIYELVRKPVFWISSVLVLIALVMAFVPQLFAPTSPNTAGACSLNNARGAPTWDKPFGYTNAGCDMWSSLVWGAGKSVIVGILVTVAVVIIGMALGTIAGWYAGFSDTLISRIADIFFGLPFILGALVFLAIFPVRNVWTISAVLAAFSWPQFTRLMRGSVISTKQRDFIDAARALGANDFFIIRKHVLANSMAPIIVLATISLGSVISAEATLTFLGVGYQRPTVSWGLLVSDGQNLALAGFWHLLVYPASFIVITVLAFILLGDVLRDALDPRGR